MKNQQPINDENKIRVAKIHADRKNSIIKLFLEAPESTMSDTQLLVLLLSYAMPHADPCIIAHNLLETFGSISDILNARIEHLQKVDGVDEKAAILIKLIPTLMRRYNLQNSKCLPNINSLDEVGRYLIDCFAYEETEVAMLVLVNKNRKVMSTHRLKFMFNKNGDSAIDEILSICISAKPHTAIFAHLHPAGCETPSQSDRMFTLNLRNTLDALRIILMEHFVITHNSYTRIINSIDYNLKDTLGL
ncbi:MAG: JAB domain-containing protein [Eubacteriales bacterium]|nr:JAB domain-containing protein [Eubacteriales bacterium]MDD4475269.1 JAB domain-containing protein [Eubacteriales bacterium]